MFLNMILVAIFSLHPNAERLKLDKKINETKKDGNEIKKNQNYLPVWETPLNYKCVKFIT